MLKNIYGVSITKCCFYFLYHRIYNCLMVNVFKGF
jgi:hypothetical protein